MKRFDQVQLSTLQQGDRFYFAGDTKKNCYTLNNEHPFEKKNQRGFTKYYANCRPDIPKSAVLQVEKHLASRRVIFLRNINDKNI